MHVLIRDNLNDPQHLKLIRPDSQTVSSPLSLPMAMPITLSSLVCGSMYPAWRNLLEMIASYVLVVLLILLISQSHLSRDFHAS